MKLHISRTTFSRKLPFLFKIRDCESWITHSASVKVLGVFIARKIHFCHDVYCIFLTKLNSWIFILFPWLFVDVTFLWPETVLSISVLSGILLRLLMPTGWNAHSGSWQLCYNRFFPHVHCSYANAVGHLKIHTWRERRHLFNDLFYLRLSWF